MKYQRRKAQHKAQHIDVASLGKSCAAAERVGPLLCTYPDAAVLPPRGHMSPTGLQAEGHPLVGRGGTALHPVQYLTPCGKIGWVLWVNNRCCHYCVTCDGFFLSHGTASQQCLLVLWSVKSREPPTAAVLFFLILCTCTHGAA